MGFAQEILSGLGLGEGRFRLIEARDPAELERSLWSLESRGALAPATFNLSNEKRATLDFIFDHLLRQAPARKPEIPLSAGAPYGRVVVDKQKCTMCLACVGACPGGALLDAKDKPQLRFIERNCVQCGLCEKTCPEDAISLVPRLLLAAEATQAGRGERGQGVRLRALRQAVRQSAHHRQHAGRLADALHVPRSGRAEAAADVPGLPRDRHVREGRRRHDIRRSAQRLMTSRTAEHGRA